MSTVSRVKPSHILYLRSYVFSPQGDLSQALHLGSQYHSMQDDPHLTLHLGLHFHSTLGDTSPQTLYLG